MLHFLSAVYTVSGRAGERLRRTIRDRWRATTPPTSRRSHADSRTPRDAPITSQMKVLVAVQPVDFRRGMDGLARLCQDTLQHDPFAGAVFVFRNRKATAVKLYVRRPRILALPQAAFRGKVPLVALGRRRQSAASWPRISSRSCSRPATRRGRARRPTGGRSARQLDPALTGSCISRPGFSLEPGWDATPARRETAGEASPRSAGGCRMRNRLELVEVDSDQLEEVLRRAEQALDEKDAECDGR